MTSEQRLARLERLERENRWMRRIGAAAVAVAAAVLLVGQGRDQEPPDLVVRSLTVEDRAGTRRIVLTAGDHETGMRLMTPDGKLLHSVGAVHGRRQHSEWILHGPQGRMTCRLSMGADSVNFRINGGRESRVALDALWDGTTRLTFFDAEGKVLWRAPKE